MAGVWQYMVVELVGEEWDVQGDDPEPYEGRADLYRLLRTAGQRGWELAKLPTSLLDLPIVFKRHHAG